MRILITSGGTKVPIDRVRDITNMSNGTFGSRIAHEALVCEHDVTFLCAKHSKTPFVPNALYTGNWEVDLDQWSEYWNFCETHKNKYHEIRFRNFDDYAELLEKHVTMERPDVVILAAAVSDYGVKNFVDGKIRSDGNSQIDMFPLPKLIGQIKQWHPDCILVGFKLLMHSTDEQLIQAASNSIDNNQCDLVVANDLRDLQANNHRLLVVDQNKHVRTYHKNDSQNIYYLARRVMEDTLCLVRSCSESPAV